VKSATTSFAISKSSRKMLAAPFSKYSTNFQQLEKLEIKLKYLQKHQPECRQQESSGMIETAANVKNEEEYTSLTINLPQDIINVIFNCKIDVIFFRIVPVKS